MRYILLASSESIEKIRKMASEYFYREVTEENLPSNAYRIIKKKKRYRFEMRTEIEE